MTGKSLVIGARGFVGAALTELLPEHGITVTGTSRRPGADMLISNGADLDRLLAENTFDQVVLTPQLTAPDVDWLIDRIDGSRWLVFSSAQLASTVPAPRTDVAMIRQDAALLRGATVFQPTMVFGHGQDLNISRLLRTLRRWRIALQIGDGRQLVQPVHIADVVNLVACHAARPINGLFPVGGDEPIPTRELLEMLRDLLGVRLPVIEISPSLLLVLARLRVAGLRVDQLLRLQEDKTVDIAATQQAFGWSPHPLAQRVEQAAWEFIGERRVATKGAR